MKLGKLRIYSNKLMENILNDWQLLLQVPTQTTWLKHEVITIGYPAILILFSLVPSLENNSNEKLFINTFKFGNSSSRLALKKNLRHWQ